MLPQPATVFYNRRLHVPPGIQQQDRELVQEKEKVLRFRCPHCSTQLRGKSSDAGQRRRCPKCQQAFRIPQPQTSGSGEPPPPKKQQLVPVICDVCQTRMHATLDQVGALVECPDCFTQNLVKPPRKDAKSAPVMDTRFSYDLGPESDVRGAHAYVQEMIAGAERDVEQEIVEEPAVPARPFLSGVLTFPFYQRVWPVILGMVISLSIALGLLKFAWDMQGTTALLAPFVIAIAGVTLLLVCVPAMVCWLTVFENTAQGDDDAEYRPEGGLFAFIDWAGDIGYLVLAISLSCTPGMLLGRLFGLSAEYLPLLVLGASLAFPVLLLSMMETASPFGIYSKPIWYSVFQVPGKWFKFYFFGTILVILACVCFVRIGRLAPLKWSPFFVAEAVAMVYGLITLATIYFRLLGRLAWVLTQEIEIEVEADELVDMTVENSETGDASEISLGV